MKVLSKLIVGTLPLVPKVIIGHFSKNYIAGPDLQDAIKVVRELNAKGMMATLDLLGEEVQNKEQSLDATEQYIDMLNEIDRLKLDCNVSVKPTHLSMDLDKEFCYQNVKRIVSRARELNNFVRIDMEDHTVTSATIDVYLRLKKEYQGHVGTVIQSYMRRTYNDIQNLIKENANLRLCKGIYVEPEEIVFTDMADINKSFIDNMDELLKNDCYCGIATHDEELVLHAFKTIKELNLAKNRYEFQMLLGVTEKLRDKITEKGHRLRVYVPYGQDWYQYSIRRLKENPRLATMVFQKVFGLK